MSLITTLARHARRAVLTRLAAPATPDTHASRLAYQREVLHFLYARRERLHGGWVSASDVVDNVGGSYHQADAALHALVCDGMAERINTLFRSRGVPATPGPRLADVIPLPTRANLRAYRATFQHNGRQATIPEGSFLDTLISGDRGIGAVA